MCVCIYSRFAPAVFDDAARLNSRHRKRLGFVFQTTGLDDRAVEDVFLFEFYDRAVSFDGARGDVANFDLTAVELAVKQVDLAL